MGDSSTYISSVSAYWPENIKTAACLVIGDEILGGKFADRNGHFMARWCFDNGIDLKRIEVVPDYEDDIVEAVRNLSSKYDMVVTSGGIGPTHDDITYPSIAKAYDLPLVFHEPTFKRMRELSTDKDFDWDTPSSQLEARKRMAQLPFDSSQHESEQIITPLEDMWVPVVVVNKNIHILPGIPRYFSKLLEGMKTFIMTRMNYRGNSGLYRVQFDTKMKESEMAEYLASLAAKVKSRGIKVGSYPGHSINTVTLVGRDFTYMNNLTLEVEQGIRGRCLGAFERPEYYGDMD